MNREQTAARGHSGQTSRADNIRSSAQRRKKSSHKKSGLIYLVLLLLVAAAGVGLSFTVLFNTETIEVENSGERYSDEAIISASGIAVGDNMPRMNISHISQNIKKKLPYIGSVSIKRSLRSTVTVRVEYTRAAIALPGPSGYVLMDATGKVLETGVAEPADYIAEIAGVELAEAQPGEKAVFTDGDMFTYVTGLVSDFENAGFRNLTRLDFSDIYNITAEVDYRITVKLGSISKASAKLKFGKKVIDENLENASSGHLVIDLTQDSTAYVRSQENIDAAEEAARKALENGALTETDPYAEPESTEASGEGEGTELSAESESTEDAEAEDGPLG